MPDMEIPRSDIYDGTVLKALKRILALKSNDISECDQVSELTFDLGLIKLRYSSMIITQVTAHGGVISEGHENEPIAFTFEIPAEETAFNTWLGTYGTDTICPTRTEHIPPVKVECWAIFSVTVLQAPLAGDVTLLEDVITVIDGS